MAACMYIHMCVYDLLIRVAKLLQQVDIKIVVP